MKWPSTIMLIRHDFSAYNDLKKRKENDPEYHLFEQEFKKDPESEITLNLARKMSIKYSLGFSDAETPLLDPNGLRAYETGTNLRNKYNISLPDVVFVSPYIRTMSTYYNLCRGWPELLVVKKHNEERIIQQDHGLANLYNDWRIFETFYPEQRKLYKLLGPYWFRYPQGENVPDVRKRIALWTITLVRDFAEKNVLVVTHHLCILAIMAYLERWDEEKFIKMDKYHKPINCGVTIYKGYPKLGKDGQLKMEQYNLKLYD